MGQMKQLMMEMEEAEWKETEVFFHCPECGGDVDGFVELPVVYEYGDDHNLPVTVNCYICNTSFEGWVQTDWDNCKIELDEFPDTEIKAGPARGYAQDDDYDTGYYEWLEQQELDSRPVYMAFHHTMDDIKALTSGVFLDQRSQMLARMLLAQSITALETYLADTLILAVSNNKDAQGRLLRSKDLGIGNIQYKLADAIGIKEFARTKLINYLNAVSFHSLIKVAKLFRVGLCVEILPDTDELELIQNAIAMRHDCVHRNGVIGRDTGKVHEIDQALLGGLAEALLRMVKLVDNKVENAKSLF